MPIDLLRQEHRTIRRALAAARHQAIRMGESGHLDAEVMNALVDFLKYFLDKCHFAKEERCLRRLLRTGNLAAQHHTLLAEHRALRRTRRHLAAALLSAEQGEDVAVLKILDCLRAFIDLLQRHLDWEEGELYPRLAVILAEENLSQLQECFERIEGGLPGDGSNRYIEWAEGLDQNRS